MTTGNHDGFSKAGNQDLSVSRDGLNEAAALELTERQVAEMFDANPAVAEAGLDGQAAPHQLAANHAAGKNTRPAPSAAKKHKNGNDEDADREPEDARDELMQLASLEDTVTDTDTADDGEAEEAVDVGGNDGEGSGFGGVGAALLGVGVIGGGIAAAAGSSGSDTPPAGGADHDDDDNDNDNDDDSDEIVLDNDEDTDIPDSIETDAEQVVLRLDGTDGADTFIIAAPNATSITLRGSVRGANDQIVFTIADADPDAGDIRTITVISELEEESGNTLVYDFGDAKDTVVLSPDSVIRGFSTIEVRSGTLDISGTDFADSIDIIVNSGIVLNLEQFLQTNSVASITDLGKLTITLANEGELTALQNYLAGEGKEKILIGIEVTVQIGDGDPIADEELDALLDAINYPGIPALSDAVDALRTQLQDVLEAMDAGFATVADELTGLNTELARIDDAIAALEAGSNAANEELLEELAAVKGELGELIATEISAIRTEILGVENAEDLNYATLAALNEAIAALEGFVSGYAETEGTLAYELAALRSEFEIAIANEINELRLELLGVVDAGDLNYATLKALNDAIAVLEGFVTGDAETEGTLAYEIAALRSDFETAIANEIDGLRSELLGVIHADELDYGTLKALNDAVKVFEDFVTGDAETLGTLANQLAGLREDIETVIADEVDALREEILGVKDADDLDYPTLAALNNAILELESIINGDAETEGSLANQIADLQRQIDELIASLEDLTSPPLETWSGDMLELQASQIFKSGWYHADLPGDLQGRCPRRHAIR